MKKLRFLALALLLALALSACNNSRFVILSGKVTSVEYSDVGNKTFVRYHLDEVKFAEGDFCRGTSFVDVPTTQTSKSVTLDETVTVECFCNNRDVIPINACKLISTDQ